MYAIMEPSKAVSITEFNHIAFDNLKSNCSAPMHFSEHTFKSLKYEEAPGVRV